MVIERCPQPITTHAILSLSAHILSQPQPITTLSHPHTGGGPHPRYTVPDKVATPSRPRTEKVAEIVQTRHRTRKSQKEGMYTRLLGQNPNKQRETARTRHE
jgi:hypothetical protein